MGIVEAVGPPLSEFEAVEESPDGEDLRDVEWGLLAAVDGRMVMVGPDRTAGVALLCR